MKTIWTDAADKAFRLMAEIERDAKGNPVTLDGCIRALILKNPDTIQWRDQALDLLYCTLGTGIKWNRYGRLGDAMPNNYMNMPPKAGGQGIWSRDFGKSDTLAKMINGLTVKQRTQIERAAAEIEKDYQEDLTLATKTIEDIDRRCQTCKGEINWYPLYWYECNLCVPAKAQNDFMEGALETVCLILDTQIPERTQEWIRLQHNKRYAGQMLKLLQARL